MTVLWLLTNSTVLLLTARLATDAGHSDTRVSLTIGIATIAQALVMAVAGHLSTHTGRSKLFVIWGLSAMLVAPIVWRLAFTSSSLVMAVLWSAVRQLVTFYASSWVSAYHVDHFYTSLST